MIPHFNVNEVLPPYVGTPVRPDDLSPYYCAPLEFAQRFATSPERIEILKKFYSFRQQLRHYGMSKNAFQWIDGSFVENVEKSQSRAPRDVDVLTFYYGYDMGMQISLLTAFPEFGNSALAKNNYLVDHYPVQIDWDYLTTMDVVKYWTMLFTHNRLQIWKGILRIELDTDAEDNAALSYLNTLAHDRK